MADGVVIDQEYEVVGIDPDGFPLKEHPKNPNKGVVELIYESIDENGWYGAVVAQKSTGYILAGNHRFRAARQRGAKEIPVIWRDVDDETALKILLVDNESTRKGENDEALVEELLQGLVDVGAGLRGTGHIFASAQEKIESDSDRKQTVGTAGTSMAARDHGADAEPPGPGEVPEDRYAPEFGVMIVCDSEKQQRLTYEWLCEQLPKRIDSIRVVAV